VALPRLPRRGGGRSRWAMISREANRFAGARLRTMRCVRPPWCQTRRRREDGSSAILILCGADRVRHGCAAFPNRFRAGCRRVADGLMFRRRPWSPHRRAQRPPPPCRIGPLPPIPSFASQPKPDRTSPMIMSPIQTLKLIWSQRRSGQDDHRPFSAPSVATCGLHAVAEPLCPARDSRHFPRTRRPAAGEAT